MIRHANGFKKDLLEFLITIAACTGVASVISSLSDDSRTQEPITIFVISYIYGISIHFSLYFWNNYFSNKPIIFRYVIPIFCGFGVGTLLVIAFLKLSADNDFIVAPLTRLLFYALLATTVIMYVFILTDQKNEMRSMLRAAELKQEKNEKQLLQSELRLLQSQIEPHFLFNTLANLRALITVDPKKSQLILDSLTSLLRQSLKQTRDTVNTLQSEINFCKSYLAIQQIRIGDRLEVNINIDSDVDMNQSYPPLLLLPIVENAILHGIEPVARPTKLTIDIKNIDDDTIELSVVDTGVSDVFTVFMPQLFSCALHIIIL